MSKNQSLPGNEHYRYADTAMDYSADAYVITQAILALAYEQRTANLIALYTSGDVTHGEVTYGLLPERAESMLKQVNERLGLQTGAAE